MLRCPNFVIPGSGSGSTNVVDVEAFVSCSELGMGIEDAFDLFLLLVLAWRCTCTRTVCEGGSEALLSNSAPPALARRLSLPVALP